MPGLRLRAVGLLALVVTILAVVATTGGAAAATRRPACTQRALQSAIPRARGLRVVKPFGCDGAWAYSAALIGSGTHEVEATALFNAHGTRWVTVSRERPCAHHQVPRKIYKPACETN